MVKFPSSSRRPSSRLLDRIHTVHHNQSNLPNHVWPSISNSNKSSEDDGLTLSHPLLIALTSSASQISSQTFSQKFHVILARLIVSGLHHHSLFSGRVVKLLSSNSNSLPLAISFFSSLTYPDAFMANSILRSYLSSQDLPSALRFYYDKMMVKSVRPNHFTFPIVAKVFAKLHLQVDGSRVHATALRCGFMPQLFTCNAFIHMYMSFGDVASAEKVFDEMGDRDVVSWNSMIDGYVKNGMVSSARKLFDEMPARDVISWNTLIAGYVGIGDVGVARELFDMMPRRDIVTWNSMIDGYARAGEVELARDLFDTIPRKSLVMWNVILALYARIKNYKECLKLFDTMMAVGKVKPDEATFVSILTACGNLGELERGKFIHSLIGDNERGIDLDMLLSTSLLTMYAKCGDMVSAKEIFEQMEEKSVVSWNSMIIGFGTHGEGEKALELFLAMEKRGPRPNENTFICVLSACCHGKMVMEGWWCFDRMVRLYRIKPKVEHLGCMVDLLGRAGLLSDSQEIVRNMSLETSPGLWGALLSACATHSHSQLGEFIAKKLIELRPRDIGPYILLSNMYASDGRWDEVEKLRETMEHNGLQKAAGTSSLKLMVSDFDHVCGENVSGINKSMVYSLLNEIGAHMKTSARNLHKQEGNVSPL